MHPRSLVTLSYVPVIYPTLCTERLPDADSRPIPDLRTVRDGVYNEIVSPISSEIEAGRPTYVHCWGGVGRTGTVVGCGLADSRLSLMSTSALLHGLQGWSRRAL
jgi:protein-tyrosine phosphatase